MTDHKSDAQSTKISLITYAKRLFYLLLIAWIGRLVSYSIEQYNLQDGENIFICDEDECFQTTHAHADITFDLCGASPTLPRESWPLDGLHTHKEKDYLHFHDRVEIDREILEETGEKVWLYEKSLTIQEVIDVFELAPEKYCDTKEVDISVLVDGVAPQAWLEHNRKDGEQIHLIYR